MNYKLPLLTAILCAFNLGTVNLVHAQTPETTLSQEPTRVAGAKKGLLEYWRGVYGTVSDPASIKAFQQIHGGFVFGGGIPRQAQAMGIPGIVHFGAGSPPPADKYPEWAMRQPDGSPYAAAAHHYGCFNNAECQDDALARAEQLARTEPMAGLILDAFWWGHTWCCCDSCQQDYQERFGEPLPFHPSWDDPRQMRRCIEWRHDTLERLYRRYYARLKAIRPDLLINIHGAQTSSLYLDCFARVNHVREGDFAYMETYTDEVFFAAWLRGISQRPVMGHAPYFKDLPFFRTQPISGYNDEYLKSVISGQLAHGSRVIMWLRWLPGGGLNRSAQKLMTPIFAEVQEKEPYLQQASPVLYTAIVSSEAVRTYYARKNPDRGPRPHLEGIFDTLQLLRVPVEFLSAELDLDLENLKKFQLVILPNVAVLSDQQAAAIGQYVREGGSILATYETGLYDEFGEIQEEFALADVFGLGYVKKQEYSWTAETEAGSGSYLVPQGDFLAHLQDLLAPVTTTSLHMTGPVILTQPTSGVSKATLAIARPGFNSEPSQLPGVHWNNYGLGKSVYLSAPLYKLIKLNGIDEGTYPPKVVRNLPFARREGWMLDLTRELLDELAPNPPIYVKGPHHLECTFFEQKHEDRIIVHLLNATVRDLGKVYPLPEATILVRKDFARPRKAYVAWPVREDLEIQPQDDYLAVPAPETHIHQIVVLQR